MTILVDRQIAARLKLQDPLVTNIDDSSDHRAPKSSIQAASLDLTIGDIHIPGANDDSLGGATKPLREVTLDQGHTAVIRTKEILHLGSDLAGIAFPPANVSLKGLLMTNPGHIDPGYTGHLHLTVINMSRVPIPLRTGDRIIRVLFIKLDATPDAPYNVRFPTPLIPITPELLTRHLSVDFLDVTERAKTVAVETVRKAQLWAICIPIAVALISLVGSYFLTHDSEFQNMKEKVAVIDSKLNGNALDDRVHKLEDLVAKLNAPK